MKKIISIVVFTVISSLSVAEVIKDSNYVDRGHFIHYSLMPLPDWLSADELREEYKYLRGGIRLLEYEKAIGDEVYHDYEDKIQHQSKYNLSKIYTIHSSQRETLYMMTLVAHPVNAVYVGKLTNNLSGWRFSCLSTSGKYSKNIKSMIFSPACHKAIKKYKIPLKKEDMSKLTEVKGTLN